MLSAKTSDTECCCAHKSGLFAFWLVVLATAFDDAPSVPYLHAHVVWHRLITGTQRYHDQDAIRVMTRRANAILSPTSATSMHFRNERAQQTW